MLSSIAKAVMALVGTLVLVILAVAMKLFWQVLIYILPACMAIAVIFVLLHNPGDPSGS